MVVASFGVVRRKEVGMKLKSSVRRRRGHLASVTSEAIEEYIIENRRDISYLWLGGSDKEEEGVWKWSDGSPWEFAKLNKGEPRNGSKEDCLIIASRNVRERLEMVRR